MKRNSKKEISSSSVRSLDSVSLGSSGRRYSFKVSRPLREYYTPHTDYSAYHHIVKELPTITIGESPDHHACRYIDCCILTICCPIFPVFNNCCLPFASNCLSMELPPLYYYLEPYANLVPGCAGPRMYYHTLCFQGINNLDENFVCDTHSLSCVLGQMEDMCGCYCCCIFCPCCFTFLIEYPLMCCLERCFVQNKKVDGNGEEYSCKNGYVAGLCCPCLWSLSFSVLLLAPIFRSYLFCFGVFERSVLGELRHGGTKILTSEEPQKHDICDLYAFLCCGPGACSCDLYNNDYSGGDDSEGSCPHYACPFFHFCFPFWLIFCPLIVIFDIETFLLRMTCQERDANRQPFCCFSFGPPRCCECCWYLTQDIFTGNRMEDGGGSTPLHSASAVNDVMTVLSLTADLSTQVNAALSIDPNESSCLCFKVIQRNYIAGETPLLAACRERNVQCVKALLSRQDVDVSLAYVDERTRHTAIEVSCSEQERAFKERVMHDHKNVKDVREVILFPKPCVAEITRLLLESGRVPKSQLLAAFNSVRGTLYSINFFDQVIDENGNLPIHDTILSFLKDSAADIDSSKRDIREEAKEKKMADFQKKENLIMSLLRIFPRSLSIRNNSNKNPIDLLLHSKSPHTFLLLQKWFEIAPEVVREELLALQYATSVGENSIPIDLTIFLEAVPLSTVTLHLLGDGASGKTSLFRSLKGARLMNDYWETRDAPEDIGERTVGIEINPMMIGETTFSVRDCAGTNFFI